MTIYNLDILFSYEVDSSTTWGLVVPTLRSGKSEHNFTVCPPYPRFPICEFNLPQIPFYLLLFGHSLVSNSFRPRGLQHTRLPCPSPSPRVCSNTHPLTCWIGNAIQPSHPLSCPSPASNLSQHQGLFQWVSSLRQVAEVLEIQLQRQFFLLYYSP